MTVNLKYALEKEDYVMFQLLVASTSDRIKKKRKRSRIIIPIIYLAFAAFGGYTGDTTMSIVFLVLSLIWFLFYPKYEAWKYKKHYNSFVDENFKSHYGLETKTQLGETEIYSENSKGNTTVKVEDITEIIETEQYLFVRLGVGMGLIFPKEKIQNLQELENWISTTSDQLGIPNQVNLNWSWT